MRDLLKKRILFFGGKGGVGKTTCASAMALAAAKQGKRVLLVSTDPAHSTSDIFERPFSKEETEIYPGLVGIEVDADYEARRYIDTVKEQIARLFSPSILKEAQRQIELVSTMPGVEEVALFDRMGELMVTRIDVYDLVIFDTAPTGHTMRLLRMPELMSSWIEALSKRRRSLISFGQNIDKVGSDPDPILTTLERRKEKLEQVRARLMQHNFTGFVLVLVPERLPIEESARAAERGGAVLVTLGLGSNNIYRWLELVFAIYARKPYVYYSRYRPSPAKLVTALLPLSRWPTCSATLASSYRRGMSSGPAPAWLTPTE